MPIAIAVPPPPPSNATAPCSTYPVNVDDLPTTSNRSTYTSQQNNFGDSSGSSERPKPRPLKPTSTTSDGSVCVTLDCPSIGDVMAARLSICILGHMLYLKSQIPFPVPQLMKMSATSPSSNGKKKLDTLLSSFDLLSSHLGTSFTALSTALARAKKSSPSTAHFAILFGPTVSAASAAASTRARIILEITGFDVRIWGMRGDEERRGEEYDDEDEDEEEDEHEVPPDSDEEDEANLSDGGEAEEESEEEVPPSPEPSDGESEDEETEEDEEGPPSSSTSIYVPSEPDIVSAERLLSRTLAQANADACNGMAAEIPPTQIHILLRAPRRFSHPAWKPHQQSGVSRALDSMISPSTKTTTTTSKSKPSKKRTDHHIRVQCQHSPDVESSADSSIPIGEDEENEFIWWSWDAGKLEGFTDF